VTLVAPLRCARCHRAADCRQWQLLFAPDPRALIDGDVALTRAHRETADPDQPVDCRTIRRLHRAGSGGWLCLGDPPGWIRITGRGQMFALPAAVIGSRNRATSRTLTFEDIPIETATRPGGEIST